MMRRLTRSLPAHVAAGPWWLASALLPLSLGLPACGEPPDETPDPSPALTATPAPSPTPVTDADEDGSPASQDCDDHDPKRAPDFSELCDGIDNDCDQTVDEDVQLTFYPDHDQDGVPASQPSVDACSAPAGYLPAPATPDDWDCDDQHEGRYPGAPVACDGHDNNCDGVPEVLEDWHPDDDRDGFGDEAERLTTCVPPSGWVTSRGDCDDQDPGQHPGAPDGAGDGQDNDCGGTENPEPSVGLEASNFNALQEAINAAASHTTIFVGPGTYAEANIRFAGKAVALVATHGPASTRVDAQQQLLPVFLFDGQEDEQARLEGFTITGAGASGLQLLNSHPTLHTLVIEGNRAERGGGIFASNSYATLETCVIQHNLATSTEEGGGGLYLDHASPSLKGCTIANNRAESADGGGLYLSSAHPTITTSRIVENQARRNGGGAYLDASQPELYNLEVNANRAYDGAGLYLRGSSPTIEQLVVVDNRALNAGGGLYLYLSSTAPVVTSSVLAWNVGGQVYNGSTQDEAAPLFLRCLIYAAYGQYHNFDSFPGEETLAMPPDFQDFVGDGKANDLLLPSPGSNLHDSGYEGTTDADGSPAEVGLTGGSHADPSLTEDLEGDGLPDRWELLHGLDVTQADASEDGDGDGLTQAEELAARTDPRRRDTDGDLSTDRAEVDAQSSPIDFYQQPDQHSGPGVAEVPGDFSTLQAAIDAIRTEGVVLIYNDLALDETVEVVQRSVTLRGDPDAPQVLAGTGGRVMRVQDANASVQSLQLQGGIAERGANLLVNRASVMLFNVTLSDGEASLDTTAPGLFAAGGAGLWAQDSDLTFERVSLMNNQAVGDQAVGGGMGLERCNLIATNLKAFSNISDQDTGTAAAGGGLYALNSTLDINGGHFRDNLSTQQGGALQLRSCTSTLHKLWLEDNRADATGHSTSAAGAGIYAWGGFLELSTARAEGQQTRSSTIAIGGALYLRSLQAILRQVVLANNEAVSGAGLALVSANTDLTQGVVADNAAQTGGGIFVTGSGSLLNFQNAVLAYNAGQNLYASDPAGVAVSQTALFLYTSDADGNSNLSGLESTYLSEEPGFLVHADGLSADYHLSLSSPLVDQGTSAWSDVDGSASDPGAYGSPGAGTFDLDGDGLYEWFWPGSWQDAPPGYTSADWDCDDRNASVSSCTP